LRGKGEREDLKLFPVEALEDPIFFQDGSDSVGARCRKGMQLVFLRRSGFAFVTASLGASSANPLTELEFVPSGDHNELQKLSSAGEGSLWIKPIPTDLLLRVGISPVSIPQFADISDLVDFGQRR